MRHLEGRQVACGGPCHAVLVPLEPLTQNVTYAKKRRARIDITLRVDTRQNDKVIHTHIGTE
jgi:hypothetical protein